MQINVRLNRRPVCDALLDDKNKNVLNHPPYPHDIAPTHYYLYRLLKPSLCGKNIVNLSNTKNHFENLFASEPNMLYKRGIEKLPDKWKKILENHGHYVID